MKEEISSNGTKQIILDRKFVTLRGKLAEVRLIRSKYWRREGFGKAMPKVRWAKSSQKDVKDIRDKLMEHEKRINKLERK